MIYLQLFLTYLKIGIFSFGGGYAMLPLIQQEVIYNHQWITEQQFTDIVAISQMTPGPIGINSATYIGYQVTGNALGSFIASFAVCLPAFLIILGISYSFKKFRTNKYVENFFTGLRPASIGLIASAALILMNDQNFIDIKSYLLFGAVFLVTWQGKINPIITIILSGVAGVVLYM